MYVCNIYLTSVKNVIITKSSIYNTNLNWPRQISFVTFQFNKYFTFEVLETKYVHDLT